MRNLRLLVLCALVACTAERIPSNVGDTAPAYAAPSLSGDTVSLAQLRGSVVLLNVWATWCIPCRKEMPELQALHTENAARGLRILGVSVDEAGSDEVIREFTGELGITYTILRDPSERVSNTFAIIGVPASYLIDRQGKIVWKHLGPFTRTDPGLTKALRSALAAGPS